jgi:hypothetical protein
MCCAQLHDLFVILITCLRKLRSRILECVGKYMKPCHIGGSKGVEISVINMDVK